jgi:hypothetical protein
MKVGNIYKEPDKAGFQSFTATLYSSEINILEKQSSVKNVSGFSTS